MNILVINCGSSSLKYQLIDMKNEEVMCKGAIERIGMEIKGGEENVIIKIGDAKFTYDKELLTHTDAFNEVKYILSEGEHKVGTECERCQEVKNFDFMYRYNTEITENDDWTVIDVNGDGVINAKDYAYIYRMTK